MKRSFFIASGIAILCWFLPYLAGWMSADGQWVFSGFLLNPLDGNSYLAKMQLGRMGEWRFTLPFTAQPGEGAYLFLFYLTLGHLARIFSLPLSAVFHGARLLADIFMLWTIWQFVSVLFSDRKNWIFRAFLALVFGSGLGWLFSPLVGITSDLWVAEAYPFLAGYVNPHFPLGISLVLWILIQIQKKLTWRTRCLLGMESLFLSVIMPFGVVVVAVVLIGVIAWDWVREKSLRWERGFWALLLGGIFLLYQLVAILGDPTLSEWNAQNVTNSPPWWDMLISFSPAIILAFLGFGRLKVNQTQPGWRTAASWAVLGLVLIAIPFALQRRFLLGFYIPIGSLAVYCLSSLSGMKNRLFFRLFIAVSVLTNVVILITAWFGIETKSPALYLTANEYEGLMWLEKKAASGSLVLASPRMGNFIPAHTSHRVIYGHPFETAQAQAELAFVEQFWNGSTTAESALNAIRLRQVDYVFYDLREPSAGNADFLSQLSLVYQNPDVKIYLVRP